MTGRENVDILVVGSSSDETGAVAGALSHSDIGVFAALNAAEAKALLERRRFAAVFVRGDVDAAEDLARWAKNDLGLCEPVIGESSRTDLAVTSALELVEALTPARIISRARSAADTARCIARLERRGAELERHVADRTEAVEAWTQRLRLAANAANVGVYDLDLMHESRHFSTKLRELCGLRAEGEITDAEFESIVHPEDRAERRSIPERAAASPTGEFDVEYRIFGPGGRVIWVMDKGRVIFDRNAGAPRVTRVLGALLDVTDRRRAQEVKETLAAIVESSQDAIISKTLDGDVTSWNGGAAALFGYTAAEMIGQSITRIIPPELQWQEQDILSRLRRGERLHSFETVRVAKDGRMIDVSVTISPIRDARGRIIGASKVSRDITERKKIESVLARDRATLERMVAERTAELERTNEQLRLADRLATIGTLSAGLGHDMGNLLLPVRIRLDSLLSGPRDDSSIRADLGAIRDATQYLQRLARSLRLLAIDPSDEPFSDANTDLQTWWTEVEGVMRNALPRAVLLSARIPKDAPTVRIGETALTQIVFNLIQNAGHAVKGKPDGRVNLDVEALGDGSVRIRIIDNGVGMSEEVRRRCEEPFFTTRTRGLGTGLGLTLVAGLARRAGGAMSVESAAGAGTTVSLVLPATRETMERLHSAKPRSTAVIDVADRRLKAHLMTVLASMGIAPIAADQKPQADLWIVGPESRASDTDIERFVASSGTKRVIHFRGERVGHAAPRCWQVDPALKPTAIRSRVLDILHQEQFEETLS